MKTLNKLLPIALLLGACASLDPIITLNPVLPDAIPSIGKGKKLSLFVVDRRENESYGVIQRKGQEDIDVVSALPLETAVRPKFAEGLTRAGFLVNEDLNDAIPQLTIDIFKLRYDVTYAGATSEIKVTAVMDATAHKGLKRKIKTLKVENAKKYGLNPPKHGHELFLNSALSELIETLLQDEAFLTFLAEDALE